MDSTTVIFPAKILSSTPGNYQGVDYTTLNIQAGDLIASLTGKGGVDFSKYVNKTVLLECELRGKAVGNRIKPELRAIGVENEGKPVKEEKE